MREPDEVSNPARFGIGLAVVAVVMIAAIVGIIVVDETPARFLFGAVFLLGVFRLTRIFRPSGRG